MVSATAPAAVASATIAAARATVPRVIKLAMTIFPRVESTA